MRSCRHGQVGLLGQDRGRFPQAFRDEMVPDQEQQLFLGEGDPRLGHHVRFLQPSQRDVRADQQGLSRDALDQLSGILAELDVLAALVLENRLLHQLLDLAAAEEGQLADDLPDRAAPRQPNQGLARQGANLVCVRNGHFDGQQRQQHFDAVVGLHHVPHLGQRVLAAPGHLGELTSWGAGDEFADAGDAVVWAAHAVDDDLKGRLLDFCIVDEEFTFGDSQDDANT